MTSPRIISHGKLYSCQECGARFLEANATTSYDDHYYASWFGEPGQDIQRIKRGNFRRLLQKHAAPLAGKRLLDIGCATGFLMLEARAQGAEVSGLDVNNWATDQARQALPGAAVYSGTLHEALAANFFPASSFDIITATDVVEHLVEVKPFIVDVLRLLKPTGTVIFTLPDPDSFSARIMGTAWFQYKAEHLTYLTRKSLKILAAELDFDLEVLKPHRKVLTLEYLSNVLAYHNRGWVSKLGRLTGTLAKFTGLARLPLALGTGEMLVKLTPKPCQQ